MRNPSIPRLTQPESEKLYAELLSRIGSGQNADFHSRASPPAPPPAQMKPEDCGCGEDEIGEP